MCQLAGQLQEEKAMLVLTRTTAGGELSTVCKFTHFRNILMDHAYTDMIHFCIWKPMWSLAGTQIMGHP